MPQSFFLRGIVEMPQSYHDHGSTVYVYIYVHVRTYVHVPCMHVRAPGRAAPAGAARYQRAPGVWLLYYYTSTIY